MTEIPKLQIREKKARKAIPRKSAKIKKVKVKKLTAAKVQLVVNNWIRQRDSKDGYFQCISCNEIKTIGKMHAGHYIACGSSSFLRFDERNLHGQCAGCNCFRHGNLIEYRIGLLKRIGVEGVEYLESNRHTLKKWTQDELLQIKQRYSLPARMDWTNPKLKKEVKVD